MLNARKQRYIEAINRLQDGGFVSVVNLILAVPIERKGKDLLRRVITWDYRNPNPNHIGIDFNAGPYAEGYAPMVNYLADGAVVTRSELAGTYGNVVDITATARCKIKGKGQTVAKVTFRFAHLHSRTVKKGDRLPLWASFGTVGNTGKSTGAHKHFEVFVDGVRINPHDLEYLAPTVDKPTQHVVQPGQTYSIISALYGVPVADLRRWNGWPDKAIPRGAAMWLVEPPKDAPEPENPVRPDTPPHPVEPNEEIEALKAQVAELKAQVTQLTDEVAEQSTKLAAVKKVL